MVRIRRFVSYLVVAVILAALPSVASARGHAGHGGQAGHVSPPRLHGLESNMRHH
jgi:hypothetical protein